MNTKTIKVSRIGKKKHKLAKALISDNEQFFCVGIFFLRMNLQQKSLKSVNNKIT